MDLLATALGGGLSLSGASPALFQATPPHFPPVSFCCLNPNYIFLEKLKEELIAIKCPAPKSCVLCQQVNSLMWQMMVLRIIIDSNNNNK